MMAGGMTFRFDLSQLEQKAWELIRNCESARYKILREGGKMITVSAKHNAPVDFGTLTMDITFTVSDDKKAVIIYVPENATSAPYAVKMHEGTYTLGPNSQLKAAKGFSVGNKYIERGLNDNGKKLQELMIYELKKATGAK